MIEGARPPAALRGEVGGRAPSSSLGEEAAQQGDGAAGIPLPDPHRRMCRLTAARLTNVFGRSRSEQTSPDGVASLSVAFAGLDQAVAGRAPNRTRTLWSDDLVRRVVAVNRLKLCLLVVASGLGLLALAVLIVLANAVVLVITLAIVGTVLFLLARRGLAEGRRTNEGR